MSDAPSGLDQVISTARAQAPGRGLPPVHLWNPAHCGEIDIVIKADGTWRHEGSPIGRAPLVRLFSTVLRLDPDGYHLVTPAEKLKITVEDSPFIAVAVDRIAGDIPGFRFTTNVGDEVELDTEHPLRVSFDSHTGEPRPYVMVRRGLEARLSRPVFYELVDQAQESADGQLLIASGGATFSLGQVAETAESATS